jgi:hypothetical protein
MQLVAEGVPNMTQPATQSGFSSRQALWTGRVLSGLIAAFLTFDAVIHLLKPAPVVEAFTRLHFPLSLSAPLGIIELICAVLYVIPRTSVLGAILLTGYLGGAIATQLFAGMPLGEVSFPVVMGVVVWGGLYLRDDGLRALVPLRS